MKNQLTQTEIETLRKHMSEDRVQEYVRLIALRRKNKI
jgi:hypothetical protein